MISTENTPRHTQILNYWFGTPGDAVYGTWRGFWFNSTPEIDQEIKDKFQKDYENGRDGAYDEWKSEPYSCLALILLLDQIPRTLFRGTPEVYATDLKAVETTKYAVENGYDKQLSHPILRKFMFMSLLHSEDLEVQKLSVTLSDSLNEFLGPDAYAKKYFDTISRFGRFPHRNELLGRVSTPEELEFLKEVKFPNP